MFDDVAEAIRRGVLNVKWFGQKFRTSAALVGALGFDTLKLDQ